jgi:hypothetical protein
MPLQPLVVEKMDLGPGIITFNSEYLGRTSGDTSFNYSIETFVLETEEDGPVDEVIISDALTVAIPLVYTDVDTLGQVIPWAKVVEGADEEKKLVVGKAIGKKLSQYAGELVIHPQSMPDGDKSKDITIFKCFPKPGPINFTYSRRGQRIANVQFIAIPDDEKPEGENYFCIGDPSIEDEE